MKYNTLIEKLQNLIKYKPKQQEIADIIGVRQSVIGNRASRNSNFSEEEINLIATHYGVDFSGNTAISKDCISLPVLGDVEASCGHGVTVCSETQTSTYAIGRKLANDLGISISESQMIFAKGDSMSPVIEGGDGLLVDTSKKDVYDGSIYCVRIEGQLYAKRLQKIPPQTIKVVSDNKDKYDPFYVDLSKKIDFDFEIVGEVKWWGRVAR